MIWPDLGDRLIPGTLLYCESSALVFEHLTVLSALTARLCFHMSVISNRLHTYTHAHTRTLTALLVPVCQRKCVDVYRALKIKRNRGLVLLSSPNATYVWLKIIRHTWVTTGLPKRKQCRRDCCQPLTLCIYLPSPYICSLQTWTDEAETSKLPFSEKPLVCVYEMT